MSEVEEKPTENVEKQDKSTEETVENKDKSENGNNDESKENEKNDSNESETEKNDELDGSSKLESEIIRQVEYYFGDANLSRDKFLIKQIESDSEGWVPLTVLMTFKRLAALSSDVNVIVDALLKSEEGLLEISEDRTRLRRHPERPIPEHNEEHRKEVVSRTAYAKGFPLDAKIDDVLKYFKPYEKVQNVTMRKYYDRTDKTYKFKGSVFVTFEKVDQVKEFIEKDGLSYKGRPLIRKWQEKYLVEKREEREQERARKEKKKKANKVEEKEKKIVLPRGTVLHFEGINTDIKREDLRDAFEEKDDFKVAYIEFRQGDQKGHVRFQEEGSANKFLEKLKDNKLKIKDDVEITLRSLSEKEETEFLDKVVEGMLNKRGNKRGNDKFGNRKRRFGNHNNGKGKKQKFNDDD